MTPSTTSLYRQVAADGATYIGLLTVVLDSLAEDLRLAGIAATRNDIPTRCTLSNHAFLLLGHLESWAVEMEDSVLKSSLLSFYTYVRSSLIVMQSETSDQPYRDLATHVTQLRITWQTKEAQMRQGEITAALPQRPAKEGAVRSPTVWSA